MLWPTNIMRVPSHHRFMASLLVGLTAVGKALTFEIRMTVS